MTQQPDQERKTFQSLMDELRAGSDEAAWELVRLYAPHVRAVVRRKLEHKMRSVFDSEDFVQDVWASLIRIRPKLDGINDPKQFVAFLASMAKHKVLDESRRGRSLKRGGGREQQILDSQAFGSTAVMKHSDRPSQIAIADERLEDMLESLNELGRKVIEMRRLNFTYVEIAAKLQIDERTARRYVERLSDHTKDEAAAG